MEEKTPDRIPKPGIAEAIHPEIGNGAAWEMNAHHLLLRIPDLSKELDIRFINNNTETEASSKLQLSESPTESLQETFDGQLPGEMVDQINSTEATIDVETDSNVAPDIQLFNPGDRPIVAKEIALVRKKKVKRSDPKSDVSPIKIEKPTREPFTKKPPKPGKLVRKAAKTVQRKETEDQKAGKQEILALSESILSAYTQWLKSLKGSDYVHPYDDDFAFVQGKGQVKEGISETFADLLATQGYKEQALEMYIKLMKKYPEKSAFFAAKIEALQ